jgi:glycosyltransferase involved in cell wall biosynthesis
MDVFKTDASEYSFAKILGCKPNTEALKIVKRSDFSIFLRDNNLVCTAGFPTKFSESIACGTPVLTNLSSDLGKYLIEGKNGYIMDISSEDKLDESIIRAFSTPMNELKKMASL